MLKQLGYIFSDAVILESNEDITQAIGSEAINMEVITTNFAQQKFAVAQQMLDSLEIDEQLQEGCHYVIMIC